MSIKATEVVQKFYQSNISEDESVKEFLHPEVELTWYATTGVKKLDLDGLGKISKELASSFDSLRAEVEKVFAKKDNVAIHFTYYVRTIENPDEEMPLAHFVALWELKDQMLYRGVQISQLGEEIDESPWS